MKWIKTVANYQVRAMRGDYLPRIPLPLLPFFLRLGRELETRAPEETVAILAGHNFDSLQEEREREGAAAAGGGETRRRRGRG